MHKNRCYSLLLCFVTVCVPFCRSQERSAQEEIARISDALRSHNFVQALALSQAALARQPDDSRIWTLRGMASAGTGNVKQALTAYQHALKLAPNYLPALEGAAQSEFQMGHGTARPLILQILAQRPEDPTSHAMLGVLDYKEKHCSGAVTHFQKAAAVIAAQPVALTEFGSCLAALNRDQDAVNAFEQALAIDPAQREARYNLALAQWNAHDADGALATLQPLVERVQIDEDAAILDAEILESKGDTERAVKLLREAILANPKDVDAYLQFAALSFDHASPKVGIDILNAGLTQLPHEPELYLVRGVLLIQLGEFARAADDFATASRFDPQLQFLGVAEGLVRSQEHRPAEALAKFRAAVKAQPNEAYAQYLLAEALMEESKPEGSPEYKEEVGAATRAIQLDPRLVAAHDLLSAIFIQNGQMELAVKHCRAALALDPSDQQALYHLIIALRKTGQKDQIPALLKRLLELREETKTYQSAHRRYRLFEAPTSLGQPVQ